MSETLPFDPLPWRTRTLHQTETEASVTFYKNDDKISCSRAHDPAQWFAKSREYMHSVKRRKPCLLSSARILKTGSLSRGPPCLESPVVTVIRASPIFEHSHSRNPGDMDIPCNRNPNPNPNRKGNMRGEYPYH